MASDSGIYYLLVSSLPNMPQNFEAKRVPISRPRLDARLRMMPPEDFVIAKEMEGIVRWARQPVDRGSAELAQACAALLAASDNRVLHAIVTFRMALRTIVAALRMRHRGLPAPGPREAWGLGPLVPMICNRWNLPDFGLRAAYPFVPELHRLLSESETLELEHQLLRVVWTHLDRLTTGISFSFEAVLIYLGRWDIVDRWSKYDAAAGQQRFDRLVTEAIGGNDTLFP